MTTAAEVTEPEVETEPETPDAEPHSDQEPQTEPEGTPEPSEPPEPVEGQTEPLTERQLNAALDKLDREAKRHRDRISEVLGEDALLLQECPLCEAHLAGWRFARLPDEDEWRAITAAVYGIENVSYNTAGYVQPCPDCDALGLIATGSKVPGRETVSCRACSGFGYRQEDTATPRAVVSAQPEQAGSTFAAPTEPPPDRDPWGRTRDDPNFGVLAGYER